MPKNEPRPFSVDNPESHDALVWIGEKGDTHPAPSGWIHEDVTPPRFEADSPEAEAHAQRAYHLTETDSPEPKKGSYSPFQDWAEGRPEPSGDLNRFHEDATEALSQGEALARDIIRTLPEEDWPSWVTQYVQDDTWGKPQLIKLPNPPSPLDAAQSDLTLPDEWKAAKLHTGGTNARQEDPHRTAAEEGNGQDPSGQEAPEVGQLSQRQVVADSSLDASSDNWWGPQSVNLNQVDVPGDAPGMEDGYGDNQKPVVDNRWLYLNGKVAIGGHWWDLAHRLGTEAGLPFDQIGYVSNMIARNQLPPEYDIAMGELRSNGYPQIWQSTLDRNAVWDTVAREMQNQEHRARVSSFLPLI